MASPSRCCRSGEVPAGGQGIIGWDDGVQAYNQGEQVDIRVKRRIEQGEAVFYGVGAQVIAYAGTISEAAAKTTFGVKLVMDVRGYVKF